MGASTRPPPGRFRPLALGQGRALLVRPCWRLGANSLRVGPHDLEGGVGRPGLGGMLRGCGSKNAFAKIRRPHCCPAWSWAGASGCRPPTRVCSAEAGRLRQWDCAAGGQRAPRACTAQSPKLWAPWRGHRPPPRGPYACPSCSRQPKPHSFCLEGRLVPSLFTSRRRECRPSCVVCTHTRTCAHACV